MGEGRVRVNNNVACCVGMIYVWRMKVIPFSDEQLEKQSPENFLQHTYFFDSDSPEVAGFAKNAIGDVKTNLEKSVKLFYSVRDRIRYDPYHMLVKPEEFKASAILKSPSAYCVPKAIVLVAAARAVEIPAAIGFADVQNHLNTEKLRAAMGTDIFTHHGYAALFLNGKWLKVTPAFNIELCKKFGVLPLEFDGTQDALLHPYDVKGRRHMEYLKYHGHFTDFPYERLIQSFAEFYPGMLDHATKQNENASAACFEDEKPLDANT